MRRGKVTAAGIPAAGTTPAEPRARDGGARGPRERSSGRRSPRARSSCDASDVDAINDQGAARPARRLPRRPGRRDPRRRRRGRERPVGAGPGHDRTAAVHGRDRGQRRRRGQRPRARPSSSGIGARARRTGPASGRAPDLSIADNLIMKRYRDARSRAVLDRRRRRKRCAERLRDPTRSPPPRSRPRRACSPAATSSGSSWPARSRREPGSSSRSSRRAASTSAPSRPSTGSSSSSARRARPRSCSLRGPRRDAGALGPDRRHLRGPDRRDLFETRVRPTWPRSGS